MTFPLAPPAGMRDLLPPKAAARAALSSRLIRLFERWGYELVVTPPFEHAEVIERGLDTVDRRDLLRFVDPSTGEVALLRPDITPQIARIVATQLADRPPPFRLCTSGSLIRQRRGRARRQRQIAQAGVELVGLGGPDGDAEVITLAARALAEVGLSDFRIELSLVGLTRAVLAAVPEAARADAESAMIRKDAHDLALALKGPGVSRATRATLMGAIGLYGDTILLRNARRVFPSEEARRSLRDLAALVARLEEEGLGERIALDLGEVRGTSYYTGASFTILAAGPGEPIGSGGRYDGLLGRFGAPAPATGFGLDLSNLEWALTAAGVAESLRPGPRFVVAGGRAGERRALAARLRDAPSGTCAAVIPEQSTRGALDYARRWGYDAAVVSMDREWVALRVVDAARRGLGAHSQAVTEHDLESLARWARLEGGGEA